MESRIRSVIAPERTAVLSVEYRDEVFARLAADLQDAGCSVHRVERGVDVGRICQTVRVGLFITHVYIPEQSGWILAAKFRLMLPDVPIWLYTPCDPPSGASMAEFVGVDNRIHYGGDLIQCSRGDMA